MRGVVLALAVFVGACGGADLETAPPDPADACGGCPAGAVCDSLLIECHAACEPVNPDAFDPEVCEALEGEGLCVQRPGAPGWVCVTDYTST